MATTALTLPMIMRWISDVSSKIVKLVEVQTVSAGRWPVGRSHVSAKSARIGSALAAPNRVGREMGLLG